jgi:hypothetical protein
MAGGTHTPSMSTRSRIPKTIEQKLSDLDDHLHLLAESRHRLATGEEVYLKSLTAELRVLACKSSGTAGLLWRVAGELNVEDAIFVHLAGTVNQQHPLSRGLTFFFVPLIPGGENITSLPAAYYSLSRVLAEQEAVFVSGRGYTHEQLIKAVAQQMGSAHEDDGVEPYLIELTEIIMGAYSSLVKVVLIDAAYVLEVGTRVLERATQSLGYTRKVRSAITIEPTPASNGAPEHAPTPSAREVGPEGSIMLTLYHEHSDWQTNASTYSFGLFGDNSVCVKAQSIQVEHLR